MKVRINACTAIFSDEDLRLERCDNFYDRESVHCDSQCSTGRSSVVMLGLLSSTKQISR